MSKKKPFKPINKPPLFQEVEMQLRQSFNTGIYKQGEKLPSERELVEQFQVSRVTIREALRNLQNLGMISVKRGIHAGAYVSEPTPQPITESFMNLFQMGKLNLAHLIDIRLYFEPAVASTAALFRKPEDIARLKEPMDQTEIIMSKSLKEARLLTSSFHLEVALITRNPLIIFLTESITQAYSAVLIESTEKKLDKKQIGIINSEHWAILEAIENKDPEKAYERAKEHILGVYDMYSKILPGGHDDFIDKKIRNSMLK